MICIFIKVRLFGLDKCGVIEETDYYIASSNIDHIQEKLYLHLNVFLENFKVVLETTSDYKLVKQHKGNLSKEEIELRLSQYRKKWLKLCGVKTMIVVITTKRRMSVKELVNMTTTKTRKVFVGWIEQKVSIKRKESD